MAFNPYQQQMYGQYNALAPYQQRLDQMQQQWNSPQQNNQQMGQMNQPQQPNIICRPVASEDEARGFPTDFTGATLILTDFAHGKVYSKSLNYQDGSALFKTFQLVPEQATQPAEVIAAPAIEYAPIGELEALKTRLAELEAIVSEKPKAKGAVEK